MALIVLLLCHFLHPSTALAQWPGEVRGRIVDALTGEGVSGARVTLVESSPEATSDAWGRFHLRGVEPGPQRLLVRGLGYLPREVALEVENGRVMEIVVEVTPDALVLEELRVRGDAGEVVGAFRIGRKEVLTSGARSVGELLEGVPGLLVRSEGVGGRQVPIMRGVGGDGVLVVVDGVAVNDPITGEADLSEIPAAGVGGVTVLPGARSARYGGRAQGGVILIETAHPEERYAGRVWTGALGRWGVGGESRLEVRDMTLSGSGSFDRTGGGFDYTQPADLGGLSAHRENADIRHAAMQIALGARVAGGESRALAAYETLARGLPGKSYTPSLLARQNLRRGRASLTWSREEGSGLQRVVMHGSAQEARFSDPAPSLGLPYDDRTHLYAAGLSAELVRRPSSGWVEEWGGGLDPRYQRIESGSLAEGAPRSRFEVGGFGRLRLGLGSSRGRASLSLTGRVDREGTGGRWYGSHEVALTLPAGPVRLHLAHRSAFSPPTLGDHFFREGVGVRPNPELRAERIPSEWDLGASATLEPGPLSVSLGGGAFAGDVRDMIIWAPDYRFVWSPANEDVSRAGLEGWVEARLAGTGLGLRGAWSHARTTYERPGLDGVQVVYRPRDSGSIRAAWEGGEGSLYLEARFVGSRNPVPAPVNQLPGFWTTHLSADRRVVLGGWRLRAALRVERLLDRDDQMIFGFPEPGRTFLLELSAAPAPAGPPPRVDGGGE